MRVFLSPQCFVGSGTALDLLGVLLGNPITDAVSGSAAGHHPSVCRVQWGGCCGEGAVVPWHCLQGCRRSRLDGATSGTPRWA